MKTDLPLEEAQQVLLNIIEPLGLDVVSLPHSLGRILARNIFAPSNVPPFNKSPLDGYALRSADTEKASRTCPVLLRVIEEIPAGQAPVQRLEAGTAVRIMTGAPIPPGADAVVKFEDVHESPDSIGIVNPSKPGSNIIWQGEDIAAGELISCGGCQINPPLIGLIASLGLASVPVYKVPRIAIMTTGSELVEPGESLWPGQIYNSNRYALQAACHYLGAKLLEIEPVSDHLQTLTSNLEAALEQADLVITTGGVSVGRYDLVKEALSAIGARILFWRIAMKPGSPMIAAVKNGKLIIGLSGNPAAAMVTFDLLAAPIILKMLGYQQYQPPRIQGLLASSFNKPSPQRRMIRARWTRYDGTDYFESTGDQSNGVLKSLVDCNVLVDVPAGSGPMMAGQKVQAFVINKPLAAWCQEPASVYDHQRVAW